MERSFGQKVWDTTVGRVVPGLESDASVRRGRDIACDPSALVRRAHARQRMLIMLALGGSFATGLFAMPEKDQKTKSADPQHSSQPDGDSPSEQLPVHFDILRIDQQRLPRRATIQELQVYLDTIDPVVDPDTVSVIKKEIAELKAQEGV